MVRKSKSKKRKHAFQPAPASPPKKLGRLRKKNFEIPKPASPLPSPSPSPQLSPLPTLNLSPNSRTLSPSTLPTSSSPTTTAISPPQLSPSSLLFTSAPILTDLEIERIAQEVITKVADDLFDVIASKVVSNIYQLIPHPSILCHSQTYDFYTLFPFFERPTIAPPPFSPQPIANFVVFVLPSLFIKRSLYNLFLLSITDFLPVLPIFLPTAFKPLYLLYWIPFTPTSRPTITLPLFPHSTYNQSPIMCCAKHPTSH